MRSNRPPSSAQIRARAALAVRNRIRSSTPLELRPAAADETALSREEAQLAYALGIAKPRRQP